MKKMSLIGPVMLVILAACAPYMYGVPQESWDRMSEPERIEAMRIYEQKEQARRQAAEERARRQAAEDQARRLAAEAQARRDALERERAQARQAAQERERRERIEMIHRGEGAYGELIRVRLQGGKIRIGDRHHHYEPVTFTIAEGETRKIAVADRQGRVFDLTATYAGGALSLEGVRFPYDRSWGRGRLYANTGTSGAHELRGVDLFIEVHARSSRVEREMPRLVIIHEPEPPVVIKEREPPRLPPVIVRTNDPPRPPSRPPVPLPVELPPRGVEIVLLSGELKVHGKFQQLERASLHMTDGESRDLVIKAGSEGRTLSLHYAKGELTIDGTPGRGRDAVRISYEKEWKGGKVYRLNLKGKVALEKLDVRVTGLAN